MLEADHISCDRGGRALFEGVSFRVSAGECLHIMGQNGVGKTTFLEGLAGQNRHVNGDFFLQRRLLEPKDSLFLGTNHGFKGCLSVQENLSFWADIYGDDTNQIYRAVSVFNLTPIEDQLYSDLSTGQKQRLSLARLCLITRPLWLLDEPFLGLDTIGKLTLKKLLEKHLNSGGFVCLTSHTSVQVSRRTIDLDLNNFQPMDRVSQEDREVLAYV